MRTAIIVLGLLVAIAGISWQLFLNKQEINENARLAEQTVEAYPVVVESVDVQELKTYWSVNGTIAAYKELMVMGATQGRVNQVFKQKGDRVKKGQVLVKVDDTILKAEQQIAQANYEKLQKDALRFEKLVAGNAMTKQQLEQVELGIKEVEGKLTILNKRIDDTAVKAPLSGLINLFLLEQGSMLGPGVPVCEIVNIDQLKLKAKVTAEELVKIKTGDELKVVAEVFPKDTLLGKVNHIAIKSDASLQYNIEIVLSNNTAKSIRPGMYAKAFQSKENKATLTISKKALLKGEDGATVFLAENGKAITRKILVGAEYGDRIEVLQGLTAGEQVIIRGQSKLTAGIAVHLVEN